MHTSVTSVPARGVTYPCRLVDAHPSSAKGSKLLPHGTRGTGGGAWVAACAGRAVAHGWRQHVCRPSLSRGVPAGNAMTLMPKHALLPGADQAW